MRRTIRLGVLIPAGLLLASRIATADPPDYLVCVSNEQSDDVSILRDRRCVASIPVGERPRGIHASPDGAFDLRAMKFLRKLPAGSDSEEFAVRAYPGRPIVEWVKPTRREP